MKRLLSFAVILCLLFIPQMALTSDASSQYTKVCEYGSGLKIVSYSSKWNDTAKLKSVYDELLKNFHGEEINLLSCIYLYPDAHDNRDGEYYEKYTDDSKGGHLILSPNRYINLYNCDKLTTVESLARTISHEYGHHFTCYYIAKYEDRSFDNSYTLYQDIRGLKDNPNINNGTHEWSLAEIAAEDYVQYFGSPTGKASHVFYDITDYEKMASEEFSSDIFNLFPQENTSILPASNVIKARDYWLKAFKYSGQPFDLPPSPSYIYVDSVNSVDTSSYDLPDSFSGTGKNAYSIKLKWVPSETEKKQDLEYTVVAYTSSSAKDIPIPVKTVYSGSDLSAVVGYYENNNTLYTDGLLKLEADSLYFIVFTKDKSNNNIVCSNLLELDIKDLPEISSKTVRSSGCQNINVLFHDSFINFTDTRPVVVEGRTMVPFRKIFEELGTEVSWDASDETITAKNDFTEVELKIGSSTAFCNGKPISLDVAPQILNSRAIIPLRFIGEAFGKEITWDSVERVVTIK